MKTPVIEAKTLLKMLDRRKEQIQAELQITNEKISSNDSKDIQALQAKLATQFKIQYLNGQITLLEDLIKILKMQISDAIIKND